MRRALIVVIVAACLLPRSIWSREPFFVPARPEDIYRRSPSCVAPAFSSAQSIEVFRVAPRHEKRKTTGRIFRDQKIVAGPRLLSAGNARALGKALERDYCYDWPNFYCAFVARYGVRIHLPTDSIDVAVCPHCGEIKFYKRGQWFRSGFLTGRLIPLLEKAFPDHPLRGDET